MGKFGDEYTITGIEEVFGFNEAPLMNYVSEKVLEHTIRIEVTESENLDEASEEFELGENCETLNNVKERLKVPNETDLHLFQLSNEENEMLKLPLGKQFLEIEEIMECD